MIYLGTSQKWAEHEADTGDPGWLGVMNTPANGYDVRADIARAADNGCFSSKWTAEGWWRWLEREPRSALFAVVPDVVGDHEGTMERWAEWAGKVAALGHTPAFVLQDGLRLADVPWSEAGAIFVGGSTEFKLGPAAATACMEAKRRGLWLHMGRVNSGRRCIYAAALGCDSVDGTFLAFAPNENIHRLRRFRRQWEQPALFG